MRDKSKDFAKNIVFLCRNMKAEHKETVLINQLLRSGTSIGANIHEAQYAQGTKDFISKLEIAQKECSKPNIGLSCCLKQGV
jgi:four helix bundle protein